MNGKELILNVLDGKAVSRTPWVPYTGSQIANFKGYTAEEMFKSSDKLLECLLEAEKQYRPDGMPPMFDLQVEAEILGCALTWYKNTPPTVCTHPLSGDNFVIPTQHLKATDGRIPLIMDTMKRFKAAKPDIAMYGLVCGPFTLASHLRGTDIFMDMYDDEDAVKALVNYCGDIAWELSEMFIEAGCDIIGAVDPLVSQISPDMFKTFLEEPYSKYFARLKDAKIPSCFFVCGDATKNIEPMCLTKPNCIAIDENVNIVEAKKITDAYKITMSGNLQLTITMLLGTQQDNQKEALELMDKMGTEYFILAPGCDVPFDAPSANLAGVGQAVHNPEAVRKAIENYVSTDTLPDIEIPDFKSFKHVTIEVITIDSKTCAACAYMVETAQTAAKEFGADVQVIERSIMFRETLAYMGKVGLSNLPTIMIEGEIRHISLIPPVERLKDELKELIAKKGL